MIRGFVKSLRKQPPTDDEIRETCEFIRGTINGILQDGEAA